MPEARPKTNGFLLNSLALYFRDYQHSYSTVDLEICLLQSGTTLRQELPD